MSARKIRPHLLALIASSPNTLHQMLAFLYLPTALRCLKDQGYGLIGSDLLFMEILPCHFIMWMIRLKLIIFYFLLENLHAKIVRNISHNYSHQQILCRSTFSVELIMYFSTNWKYVYVNMLSIMVSYWSLIYIYTYIYRIQQELIQHSREVSGSFL